tara:strand:+ start:31112 stop:31918 length:807 start_codon:yes stop_codon:yes gene_type:complete
MSLTEEERFRFDLAGFFVRPAILTEAQIRAIREQIYLIKHNPQALPEEHQDVPGGPSSILIDHPAVVDVISEIISPNFRLENSHCVWRKQGEEHGELHGGGPKQIDPIFGYRVQREQIYAGMVRVIFELTEIKINDQSTHFLVGSHKANFPIHNDHMSLENGKRSEFLMSYSCPPGSAIFFTENICHAGPKWNSSEPRVAVLHAYSHLATNWHRLNIPSKVMAGLPREKLAYFREPWVADFRQTPAVLNTVDRFKDNNEGPINTETTP